MVTLVFYSLFWGFFCPNCQLLLLLLFLFPPQTILSSVFLHCHGDESNMLNGENPTCCVGLCILTNRLMIPNAGTTMTEGAAILNYWSEQQSVIFRHWQLKSIPGAIKNICFPLFSSLSAARHPNNNGMINVQRQNRMPLVS